MARLATNNYIKDMVNRMIKLTIGRKDVEGKFGYGALFRANSKFSNHDNQGNSMDDGAAMLFYRLTQGDVTVISDILSILVDGKVSETDVFSAVDDMTGGGNQQEVDELMDTLKEEMLESGFFNKTIQKYIKTLEEGIETLKAKEDEDSKMQVQAMQTLLDGLNEAI